MALLERAGDLTLDELRERVAPPTAWVGGVDPLDALRASGRLADWQMPETARPGRIVPRETPRPVSSRAGR